MTTTTLTRNELAGRLDRAHVFFDRLTAKRDGTFLVKRAYFYRFDETADAWANKVRAALNHDYSVIPRDDFAAWPKTSYFTAIVRAQIAPTI